MYHSSHVCDKDFYVKVLMYHSSHVRDQGLNVPLES